MINNNDTYLNESKKTTESFVLKYLYPFLYFIIFIFSPITVILLTIILTLIFYISLYKKIQLNRRLVNLSLLIYLLISLVYSCLPSLQLYSFKIFNSEWEKVDGKIIDYKITWERATKTSAPSAVSEISYSYVYKSELQKDKKFKALTFYSNNIWNSKNDKHKLIKKLNEKIKQCIRTGNYEILVNHQKNSKIFIPLDTVLFKSSLFAQIIIILFKFILLIIFIIYIPDILKKLK